MTLGGISSQLPSSGLPSLGGSFDNPTFNNRSLGHLKASSDALWTQHNRHDERNITGSGFGFGSSSVTENNASSSIMGSTATAGSTPLVVTKRLPDLVGLTSTNRNNSISSPEATQSAETDFLQWEQANRRREVEIMSRIVQTARTATRNRSQEMLEQKMESDWKKTMATWTKEVVGSRTLGGSAYDPQHQLQHRSASSHDVTLLLTDGDRYSGDYAQPGLSSSMHVKDRRVDPGLVQAHSKIVRELQQKTTPPTYQEMKSATNEMRSLADSMAKTPGSSCYSSALQMIAGILSRPNVTSLEVALATLAHFGDQYESHILCKVRSVEGTASTVTTQYKNTNATTIATFSALEVGSGTNMGGPMWPCLFHCLRIGDAAAAKEIFETNATTADGNDETNQAIVILLTSLTQRQGAGCSIWQTPGPLTLPPEQVRKITEACELAKAKERQDVHQIAFLSLLSGVGAFLTPTIEDYLYGLLWKALQSSSPVEEMKKLGSEIRKLGSGYFGDELSGGWSYSLPLFATQQYRTGLTYLTQVGGDAGLLQATHLGMLLASCGVDVDNLGDTEASSGRLVNSLLVEYSTWLHMDPQFGPFRSLEYLRWIPNTHIVMNEVVALILRSDNFYQLTGELSVDGTRQQGELDNHFSSNEISLMLKQAAERCLRDASGRNCQTTAGVLFMLSGDYKSVIAMMSRLMDPNPNPDADNLHWYHQAKQFDSMYISKNTPVSEALQSTSSGSEVVTTFRVLTEIFAFFSRMSERRADEAWAILDRLHILPKHQSDIPKFDSIFQGLDPLVQKAIPSVLMTATQSLYEKHAEMKRDSMHLAKATTMGALSQLKDRARVLVSFAGILSSLPPGTIESISCLEASMI